MLRIIAKRTLKEYWEKNPDSEQHLKTWYETAKKSDWGNFNEIIKTYQNASIVGNDRVVFNIKGNSYRLIVKFNFERGWAFIRFIGTHREYDKIDASNI
ncbi:MAG: type II toxin-antitoxin system HigB family toxin [Bacteroidia bacterium]|nr:type II toxin-antitoxin system HigB family toxin [Bacteroidia bacterium]